MTEQQRFKNTEQLLFGIVSRLSGRDDLKTTSYTVKIDSKNRVKMSPLVYVYPNRHNRLESDKLDIVNFILNTRLNERGQRSFVPGEYEYRYIPNVRRRKWTRKN